MTGVSLYTIREVVERLTNLANGLEISDPSRHDLLIAAVCLGSVIDRITDDANPARSDGAAAQDREDRLRAAAAEAL